VREIARERARERERQREIANERRACAQFLLPPRCLIASSSSMVHTVTRFLSSFSGAPAFRVSSLWYPGIRTPPPSPPRVHTHYLLGLLIHMTNFRPRNFSPHPPPPPHSTLTITSYLLFAKSTADSARTLCHRATPRCIFNRKKKQTTHK
jgi:hypothetical protein